MEVEELLEWMNRNKESAGRIFNERAKMLRDGELRGVSFTGLDLTGARFGGRELSDSTFRDCNLHDVQFTAGTNESVLSDVTFTNCTMNRTAFGWCNLQRATFDHCQLAAGTHFNSGKLSGCKFKNSSIVDVVFGGTEIRDTSFLDCTLNPETTFTDAIFVDTTFDRYAIDSLGDKLGKMTRSQLADITIVSDLSLLRTEFGGIWGLFHLCSFMCFLFPYAWFLFRQLLESKFSLNRADSMTLIEALARYTVTGGIEWQTSWRWGWSFPLALVITFYNTVRMLLLWKTKRLETQENVKGFPIRFSLEQMPKPNLLGRRIPLQFKGWGLKWRYLYRIVQFGFWISLGAVVWHTYLFMLQRVPV